MTSTAEQLRALYTPEQLRELDLVSAKLKEDPKALEPQEQSK